MNQFNLSQFITKFINNSALNFKGGAQKAAPTEEFILNQTSVANNIIQNTLAKTNSLKPFTFADLKMNQLASLDRSLYVKDLMNLPKEMEQALLMLQNNLTTKDMANLLARNINLSQLAELMQQGGKEALNKLVLSMAEASKQGMSDLSQIKDAMKLINASVSTAVAKDNSQVLKSFMLLYLPWLPLQEGVGFELEIETSENRSNDSESPESYLTIMISTRNYGNLKATLILIGLNSIDIIINCSDNFPNEELMKRIKAEGHSTQSNIVFEQNKQTTQETNATPQAKVNISNPSEINPFLLLMAHALIRHTIELDNQAG